MWILNILALNLAIVFIVEITLGFILGAKNFKKIVNVALINIITNPPVVLSMLSIAMFFYEFEYVALIILELGVVFFEGFLFSKFNVFENKSPYLVSFLLNLSSFLIGELLKIFL